MSRITITIDSEDVATLREVFSLALVQSEAVLDDESLWGTGALDRDAFADALVTHDAVCRLMTRIDDMLPDSTGFFD